MDKCRTGQEQERSPDGRGEVHCVMRKGKTDEIGKTYKVLSASRVSITEGLLLFPSPPPPGPPKYFLAVGQFSSLILQALTL